MTTNSSSTPITSEAIHIEGLPNYAENQNIFIALNQGDGKLIFRDKAGRGAEVALDFSKLNRAEIVTEEQLQKRSVLKRAVVGKMLFGQRGARLGALSAAAPKKVQQNYYIITYTSSGAANNIVLQIIDRDRNFAQLNSLLQTIISSSGAGAPAGGTVEL